MPFASRSAAVSTVADTAVVCRFVERRSAVTTTSCRGALALSAPDEVAGAVCASAAPPHASASTDANRLSTLFMNPPFAPRRSDALCDALSAPWQGTLELSILINTRVNINWHVDEY